MTTATLSKGIKTFSQAKFDKFVAQQVRSMSKMRSKKHRDFVNMSDDAIKVAAEMMARCYNAGECYEWSVM